MYPSAIIFSSYQKSIHLLVDKLIAKGIKVYVVDPTSSVKEWSINNFLFKSVKSVSQIPETPSYIFVNLISDIDLIYQNSFEYIKNSFVKTIISVSETETQYDESLRSLLFSREKIVKIIRFGEIIGESKFLMDFLTNLKFNKHYFVSELTHSIPLISRDEFCEELVREAFSYGTSVEFGVSHFVSVEEVLHDLQKVDSNVYVSKKSDGVVMPFFSEKINVRKPASQQTPSLAYEFAQLNVDNKISAIQTIKKETIQAQKINKSKNKSLAQKLFGALFVSIIIFLTPYFLLFTSYVFAFNSFSFYKNNDLKTFAILQNISSKSSYIAKNILFFPSSIPVVSNFFTPSYDLANSFLGLSKISKNVNELNLSLVKYKENISNQNYLDAKKEIYKIGIASSSLSQESQIINTNLNKFNKISFIKKLGENYSNLSQTMFLIANISSEAPKILGFDYNKTYLVYTDNKEMFSIYDFENGKVVGEEVYDFRSLNELFSGKFVDGEKVFVDEILEDPQFSELAKKLTRLVDLALDRGIDGVFKFDKKTYEEFYKNKNYLELAKTLSSSKDYYVYLNENTNLASVLGAQTVNGEPVSFEINENNIGGNNANVAITRNYNLNIYLGANYIKNKLVLNLKNNNKVTSNIPESRYKSQIELFVKNGNVKFSDVFLEYKENNVLKKKAANFIETKTKNGSKITFDVDVNPSVEADIVINWSSSKVTNFENVLLNVVSNNEILQTPFLVKTFYDNLTKQEISSYNTALSREITQLIEIK